jgi:hypothetical protein
MWFEEDDAPVIRTPGPALPEMTFGETPSVVPTVLLEVSSSRTPGPPLPRAAVPAAFVPMRLPLTVLKNVLVPEILTPPAAFPEMTLPSAARLFDPLRETPNPALATAAFPLALVPT